MVGRSLETRAQVDLVGIPLPKGRHILTAALPGEQTAASLATSLRRLLAQGQSLRDETLAAAGRPVKLTAREWTASMGAQVGGRVADVVKIPSAQGAQLAVAEGNAVHLLNCEGKESLRLQTDGRIHVLRWWNEAKLLLAGCADERVVAFDASGRRRWAFTSQMDPAVYEAAKTYWFKSAPGHEGIHGLYSGTFDQGKSRCFVGSACTLEILDETGKLVKRTPIFWGPGRKFLLVPGRDNSTNLLISRWPNGNDTLAIVNSHTMGSVGRGYDGMPAGHSYVGGWTAQNRTALFHEDLDADGKREIVTAINGTWNRVTVYSEQGQPLYNAQFGPGASNAPRAQMRDLDVADLNGDGKKELIVGHSEGLIVALSGHCERIWSVGLPSPPVSFAVSRRTAPSDRGSWRAARMAQSSPWTTRASSYDSAGSSAGQRTWRPSKPRKDRWPCWQQTRARSRDSGSGTKDWRIHNGRDFIVIRARRGSPDPADGLTEGLPAPAP